MTVLTLGPADAHRIVLFAAGAGGDPERYRPLLERLAAEGCRVVAPHFDRLTSPEPPVAELIARPAGLVATLCDASFPDVPVAAVGHSIGGWAALCLAGATPWGRDGRPVSVPREPRIDRLVLFAPAAGWFGAAGALDSVTTPMLVYVGAADTVTPPEQSLHLRTAPTEVDVRVVARAGHLSFMHAPPPGATEDPALDRDRLLDDLTAETAAFVAGRTSPG